MRMSFMIITLLVLSLALLTGFILTNQTSQISKETIAKSGPYEPEKIIELEPAPEPPRENVIVQQPEPEKVIEPPKQDIVQPAEQSIEVRPPQRPVQVPQATSTRLNVREGLPQNYVLRSVLLSVFIASPTPRLDQIRVRLTDDMLTNFPEFKQALIKINATTAAFIKRCAPEYLGIGCADIPMADIGLNEQQLNQYVELLDPTQLRDSNKGEEVINRTFSSIVAYKGVTYRAYFSATWKSP